MQNPYDILKKGVNMFRAKKVAAKTAADKMAASAAMPTVPKKIVKATPGGKVFSKRADDLKRALNDEF